MDTHVSLLQEPWMSIRRVNGFFGMDVTMDIAWVLQPG